MSKLNTPNPSSTSKLNQKSQFLGSGIFDKKGITTALLLTALNGCGGGGSDPSSPVTPSVIGGTQPIATPLSSIPTQATGMIELGPISGGSVSFATASGGTLGSYTTGSDGSISYNPRDIISRMGNASYIIVTVSGGQDTDADDDGVRDTTPTPIVGSFRMIVLRSSLERGDRIVVNPRAGAVSETLLGRSNPSITLASLDHIARETGADDQNNDGVTNYRDLMSVQMKSVTGVSGIVPAVSGYIASVHSGDISAKQRALKNIAKTENHILLSIVPHSNPGDHTPMVKLESISGGNILYTLDGSSPIPGGSTTRTGVSGMIIPMQGAKLYYREQFVLSGETVLGKVAGFDLTSDWTELAQISVPYNSSGAPSTMTDTYSYKNIPYTITTLSNNISPGYTYPKTIDCRVGTTAGCHLGPYMAWTPEHEARVRSMIATGVQNHIDTPGVVIPVTPIVPVVPVVPTPPSLQHTQNQSVTYTTRVNNYYGGFYEVFNTYNLSGTSDFPVQISGIYGVRNQSTQTPAILMAANETERVQKSNQMVANIQSLIQAGYNNTPAPSYPQNSIIDSGAISYRGYSYRVLTTMNLSGTSDYPASVRVSYTTPLSGNNTTLTIQANSATELTSVQAERANDARARIDLILDNDRYAPNQQETMTNTTSYGGGSYRTLFTYSGNAGQDYPGYVDVYITYRNGLSDKLTIAVENANQKSTYAANLETQAKMQIDNYNTTYPLNYIRTDGPYLYGNKGSEYSYKVKYNRVGTGTNYPALVWIEYRSRSTGQLLDTRTTYGNLIANTSVEKDQIKATLLQFVQGQMVALGGVGGAQLATAWRFENILPMSTAYAAMSSSTFAIQSGYTTLAPYSYQASTDTRVGKFLGNSGVVIDHIVGKAAKGKSVAGVNQAEIEKKVNDRILSELGKYEFGQTIYLGDIPATTRGAIENVFLDLGKYVGNLPGLIQKHNANLINVGVPQSIINNMWNKIDTIWSKSMEPLGTISSYDIALTVSTGGLLIKYIRTAGGIIIAKFVSGPGAKEYLLYEASLLAASGVGELGPGTVKLLSTAITAEQLQFIAIAKAIPGISIPGRGASILYASQADIEVLLVNLVKNGWKYTGQFIATDGTQGFNYLAADGLSTISYRLPSVTQFGGFTVSATLDLYKIVGNSSLRLGGPSEIKFILPNVFTP